MRRTRSDEIDSSAWFPLPTWIAPRTSTPTRPGSTSTSTTGLVTISASSSSRRRDRPARTRRSRRRCRRLAPISVGKGITKTAPGSVEGLHVVVTDIVAARDELVGRGADVGEIFHFGESGQAPGPHPERADHGAFASFSDPYGNTWVLGGQPKRDGRVTRPVEPTDDIAAAIAGYERAFA